MRILITGGAGFIGSNFIRHLLRADPEVEVLNLDALTYAGNLENLADLGEEPRHRFVKGDISNPEIVEACFRDPLDAIVNLAAESHVDRSILDSSDFLKTNVRGTQVLLEAARKFKVPRFVQVSSDEVYGSLGETGKFTEETPLAPNSPYSASKAAADLFVRCYHQTYGLDAVITRCSNNYGGHQFPEKLIPLMILNALDERELPVYGDGLYIRDWIHVSDHCHALDLVLRQGRAGEVYNIGADQELNNLEVVHRILDTLGKPASLIQHVQDRPGHDRRYAISSRKLREELAWQPRIAFEQGLEATVQWYRENRDWVGRVRSGAYRDYYDRLYLQRDRTLAGL